MRTMIIFTFFLILLLLSCQRKWHITETQHERLRISETVTATDGEMDQLIAGYTDPDRGRPVRGAKEFYREGGREFVLKFDDTSWVLSEPTRQKFWAVDCLVCCR